MGQSIFTAKGAEFRRGANG